MRGSILKGFHGNVLLLPHILWHVHAAAGHAGNSDPSQLPANSSNSWSRAAWYNIAPWVAAYPAECQPQCNARAAGPAGGLRTDDVFDTADGL